MPPPLLIGGLTGLSGLPRHLCLLLGLLALNLRLILGGPWLLAQREHHLLSLINLTQGIMASVGAWGYARTLRRAYGCLLAASPCRAKPVPPGPPAVAGATRISRA